MKDLTKSLALGLMSLMVISASYDCALPANTGSFSAITEEDCSIGFHNVYTGLAVGGVFRDEATHISKTVDGESWLGSTSGTLAYNFNGGKNEGVTLADAGIDFDHFKWLAQNLESNESGDYKIEVLTSGGSFDIYDFRGANAQGSDNGKTLIVFNTADDVYLDSTHDSRQFGPSVLAPFSNVYVADSSGYVDGFVVAKTLTTTGTHQGSLQLHGKTYSGDNLSCTSNPGSGGDPHIKTWKNEHYEYHGQCDLVLMKNPEFANGLGLDVQIRTKIVRYWSYIKNAAISIGEDVLEVEGSSDPSGDFKYWINFEPNGELTTIGGFPITIRKKAQTRYTRVMEIDLDSVYPGQKIVIGLWKEFVRVDFKNGNDEAYGNSEGLLGNYRSGKTLARDGVTELDDFTELGNEWQVLPAEHMLFHTVEEPQFPQRCVEPEDPQGIRNRRLDESTVTEEQAEKACASLPDELDRKDCIYDILATQDLEMVGAF